MKSRNLFFLQGNARYKYLLLIGGIYSLSVFFSGCKKELTPGAEERNQQSLSEKETESRGHHAVVVSPGGSIQAAVDAASPNSEIQIKPGVYNEAVVVNKPGIKLIGLSGPNGNCVIIQNPGDKEDGISVSDAGDGFVLKNVTIKNFEENGVLLTRVNDFTLSDVTAINNGEYGIFPVFCSNGKIDHCTATGHTDTGIYVGQSSDVTVQFNTAFGNVNGLEIENCSNIIVRKNNSYDNVCGILSVLLPGLTVKTSSGILITENRVNANNHVNFAVPGGGFEGFVPSGSGILVVGTDNTTVKDNEINHNNFVGIAVVSTLVIGSLAGLPPAAFADIEPNPDGAKITKNDLSQNGMAPPQGLPLPGADLLWDGSGANNCWKRNNFTSSVPSALPACN